MWIQFHIPNVNVVLDLDFFTFKKESSFYIWCLRKQSVDSRKHSVTKHISVSRMKFMPRYMLSKYYKYTLFIQVKFVAK